MIEARSDVTRILNDLTGERSPAARRNPSAIEELCDAPLLGVFPYLPGVSAALAEGAPPGSAAAARLRRAAGALDLAALEGPDPSAPSIPPDAPAQG